MEYSKLYYQKNKESIKQKTKEYKILTDYDRLYYLRNKERIKNRIKNKYLEYKDHTDVKYKPKDIKTPDILVIKCNLCNKIFFSKQTLKYHQDHRVCYNPFTIIYLD